MFPVAAVIILLSGIVVDAALPTMVKPGCRDKCGNVTIPYPFGIGPNCYYNEWYSITCGNFTPTLSRFDLQVLQISLYPHEVRVYYPFSFNCTSENSTWTSTDFSGSPYTFSNDKNVFAPVHCPATAFSDGGDKLVALCGSVCDLQDLKDKYMSSLESEEPICLTNPPYPLNVYSVNFTRNSSICSYVFLVDGNYLYHLNLSQPQSVWSNGQSGTRIPAVLDWVYHLLSDNANPNCAIYEEGTYDYTCTCPSGKGLAGNPYLPNGCQHSPECAVCNGECYLDGDDYTHITCYLPIWNRAIIAGKLIVSLAFTRLIVGIGSLFIAFGCYWLRRLLKRRKDNKQRGTNFKRNGGLLLQQQISSTEGVVEKAKLFTVSELEVATGNFNQDKIIGQGGQGTVYKGMLADGKIVAVKKSKKVDKAQLTPFINEVVILSQINHRNVVKLLGCCLETDVPLLVYEFIPNGTLSERIHNSSEDSRISWQMRMQIASESAGAIAYLHSACSAPIYHRDIKSSNILLDEKYRAKVSDFGISRTIMIDQTHLSTQVAGTFGYFDPEYFLSTQFTDKSDVYSFGVVLVELLTSRRPISPDEFQEWRSLSTNFLHVMENSQLLDILDGQILNEGKMEEFLAVANLAKECLNTCGKQRPTMKQVATVLEGLRSENGDSSTQQTFPELNQMDADVNEIGIAFSNSSAFSSRRYDSFIHTV
ncbi:hypothetical protein KSS87_009849 [Heliosperma pusillum]|nr:hypothetical protein KSS87_009849 [Heliosperma pusillum]